MHAAGEDDCFERQLDMLEERLLQLVAGLHQQVAADLQDADHLTELAVGRLEGRLGAVEEQQQRLDQRLVELTALVQGLDGEQRAQGRRLGMFGDLLQALQTARAEADQQLQRRITDLQQNQRALARATHAAAARDEEAQRRQAHRLRPIEERLSALERERCRRDPMGLSPHRQAEDRLEEFEGPAAAEQQVALCAIRELEAVLQEELVAIHARCDYMQGVMDAQCSSMGMPLDNGGAPAGWEEGAEGVSDGLSIVSPPPPLLDDTDSELRRRLADRSAELARHVHADFAEAKQHLDLVVAQIGELNERVRCHEEALSVSAAGGGAALLAAPVPGVSAEALRRVEDLEVQVREHSAATASLRENLLDIRRTLAGVKQSIDHALARRHGSGSAAASDERGSPARLSRSAIREERTVDPASLSSATWDMSRGRSATDAWAEADAVLCVAKEILAKQQQELALLTARLNLDCLGAGAAVGGVALEEGDAEEEEERSSWVRTPWRMVRRDEPSDAPSSSTRRSPSRGSRRRRLLPSSGSPSHEEVSRLSAVDSDGEGNAPVPWSALAHLSAAFAGFGAALHHAEASGGLRVSTGGGSGGSGQWSDEA